VFKALRQPSGASFGTEAAETPNPTNDQYDDAEEFENNDKDQVEDYVEDTEPVVTLRQSRTRAQVATSVR